MNLNVGQAFQPAGLPDFPVRWAKYWRLESRPNPQAGKPALQASHGSGALHRHIAADDAFEMPVLCAQEQSAIGVE